MAHNPRPSRAKSSVDHSAITADDIKLIAYLDNEVLMNYACGYLYRAEQAREWFLEDGKIDTCLPFHEEVKDQDYAWRVLRRPAFIANIIDRLENGDNDKLTDEQKAKVEAIMLRLADSQQVDVVLFCNPDDQDDVQMELAEPIYHYIVEGELPETE
jgi:hypothetical protein